jgi:hypothetical protein
MELYFEKEYASIHFDKDNGMLIMKWIMSPMSVEYREGLNSLLVAIDKFRTGKVIFNIQNVGALHPDDSELVSCSGEGRPDSCCHYYACRYFCSNEYRVT